MINPTDRPFEREDTLRAFPLSVAVIAKTLCLAAGLVLALYPSRPVASSYVLDPSTHQVFRFLRSHSYPVVFLTTWALEGMRRVPEAIRWTALALLVTLLAVPSRWAPAMTPRLPQWRPWFRLPLAAGAGALTIVVCQRLAVSLAISRNFGDGPALPVFFGRGDLEPGDVATTNLFQLARWYLNKNVHDNDPTHAIQLVDYLSGGVFVGAIVHFACLVGRSIGERLSLFFGIAVGAYAGMFFGYIETTQVETATMAIYFAAASSALLGETERSRSAGLVWAFFALGFAANAHGAGMLLWPSAVLVAGNVLMIRRDWKATLLEVFSARNLAFFVSLLAVPWLLIVFVPFFSREIFGNAAGGGDRIMFVPTHLDYAHRPSPWVYYTRFSTWHLADIANGLWAAAPMIAPLLAIGIGLKVRSKLVWDDAVARVVWLLITAAIFCSVIPLFWNHDFGVWGDWNISVTYWLPMNAAAWTCMILGTRAYRRGLGFYVGVVAPVVLVQFGAWMGLMMQLYAA